MATKLDSVVIVEQDLITLHLKSPHISANPKGLVVVANPDIFLSPVQIIKIIIIFSAQPFLTIYDFIMSFMHQKKIPRETFITCHFLYES